MTFDLAIIGGGPAGYHAAVLAARKNKTVILFERAHLGGICLNEGCIPTKTLLYSSKIYDTAINGKKYGIFTDNVKFEYEKIIGRKNKLIRKLNAGIRAKLNNNLITIVEGEATVTGAKENITIVCKEQCFQAEKLLLCTGSHTVLPPIKGLDINKIWTSKEALETKQIPTSITIIGGGVIGMEFASLFNSFGSQVTDIEMANEILSGIDSEIANLLQNEYTKKGVVFHLSSQVTEIAGNTVTFVDENGEKTISSEQVLICVGRKPNLEAFANLNLETVNKRLKTDNTMCTSIHNIYAAGDITGYSMLAHTATREAEVAVNNMFGYSDTMDYSIVPAVVYTNPEIAAVGKTEQELQTENSNYKVYKTPMTYSGRFVTENENFDGLCKLITDTNSVLIGAHLVGNPASEIITIAAMAIELKMTIEQFQKIIFPHPSVSEIFKETLS